MATVRVHMPPASGSVIGAGSAAGGVVGGPAPPAVYMGAPDPSPKQGCVDACLGRSANPNAVKVPKKKKLKPGEEAQKRFYFRLDKIVATFDSKLEEAFLELEVGGQLQQSAADAEQTVTAKRKVKDADGKEVEEEFQKRVIIHRVEVLKPRAATFFTRLKRNLKPKTEVAYHDHSFEGYWTGPYSDLAREFLTIKLWHGGGWSTQNTLIGVGTERLSQVVASKIDREIRVLKYVPGGVSFRKETMARIRLKFELQEDYAYNIVFKNWELRRLHEPIYPAVEPLRWCCFHAGQRTLSFEVMQSRQGWGAYLAAAARAYLLPCADKRWENRCELPVAKEGTSGRHEGVIRYPGTRAWLEDESVSITLRKHVCCCIPVTLGHKAEELQGVLDYGHIDTTIEVHEDVNALTACTDLLRPRPKQMFKIAGTVDSSSMTDGDSLPLYRQLGNADPSMDGLLAAEPGTFLVVKVVLARGLSIPSRDEFKETLNPSVSVHWNGMQKSTRVARGSCDPFWDDEVHFKLPDRHTTRHKPPKKYEDFNQATRDSRIELMVWDNDGLAGRTALGKCHVDFFDVYFRRSYRKIISFASNGRHVERLVFQSGEMALEAPFATDGAERKKAAAQRGLGELEQRGAKDEFNTRFVEFLVYFDRTDSNPVPLIHKKQRERDALAKAEQDKKHIGEALTAAAIKSGRAYWDQALKDVMERSKRFFPFYGVDELSGTLHFLPSFLKPMQPPAEIRNVGTLMFYVYAIEHARKGDTWLDPAKDGTNPPRGDVWTWADPFFFLEKRKGDTKDHAIVLCNFLMGLGLDAYVCIGTARAARGAPTRAPTPHFWVMTREESFEPLVAADGMAAPGPAGSGAGASGAPGGPAPPPSGGGGVPMKREYFIRFWETTNGRTYAVKGNLTDPPANTRKKQYLEQADVRPPPVDQEEFKRARERQLEAERQRALGLGAGGGSGGLASPSGMGEGGEAGQNGQGDEEEEDGALLALAAQAAADQAASASSSGGAASSKGGHVPITIDGAMRASMTEAEILQLELHNQSAALDLSLSDPEENVSDLDLLSLTGGIGGARDQPRPMAGGAGGGMGMGGGDAHKKAKAALEEKADMESVRSVFDEQKLARVQQARELRKHQKRLVADLEDPLLRAQKKALGRQCPYASVDVVFNHKHLYANLGPSDPEMVLFDFERHPDRWCEFHEQQYKQYLHIAHLREFYPDRGLASVKAPQRDAEELEATLTALLKDTIATHRKYPSGNARPSMDTEFLRRFDFQIDDNPDSSSNTALAYIQKRLEHEHAVALQPRELLPLQQRLGHAVQLDYEYIDNDWRPRIVQELPSGYVYREECLFFKHSDSNRIATDTIRRCQAMIELAEHRAPRFAVGCQLYRMAASVCPVRVFVCVIAKDE